MTTSESNTKVREIDESDGVHVADEATRKPRLIAKQTKFGDVKIRLMKQDTIHLKRLYDDLGDLNIDIIAKGREFGLQEWVTIPPHIFRALKPFYDVKFVKSRVLEELKRR